MINLVGASGCKQRKTGLGQAYTLATSFESDLNETGSYVGYVFTICIHDVLWNINTSNWLSLLDSNHGCPAGLPLRLKCIKEVNTYCFFSRLFACLRVFMLAQLAQLQFITLDPHRLQMIKMVSPSCEVWIIIFSFLTIHTPTHSAGKSRQP